MFKNQPILFPKYKKENKTNIMFKLKKNNEQSILYRPDTLYSIRTTNIQIYTLHLISNNVQNEGMNDHIFERRQ